VNEGHVEDVIVTLTADIVAAHVSNNSVAIGDVGKLIASVHGALVGLGLPEEIEQPRVPAVSIRTSVKSNVIICLDCGARLKMLKRHLSTHHGLSIEEYKNRWELAADYPVVAPEYAEQRRVLAVKIGLGRGGRGGGKKRRRSFVSGNAGASPPTL